MTQNNPAAAARGIAERLIDMMAMEVDAFVITAHNAEKRRSHDPERTRQRIDDAREELARSAVTGVDGVDVRTDFVDLRTAQDAEARISNHIAEACIRMNGPNRIRIHCVREDARFRVQHVSAREYGQIAEVEPAPVTASQADVYANAILNAFGL